MNVLSPYTSSGAPPFVQSPILAGKSQKNVINVTDPSKFQQILAEWISKKKKKWGGRG